MNFDLLHEQDMARVRYAKLCSVEGRELEQGEIVRGFEFDKGEYVIVTDEDLRLVAPVKAKTIEILQFAYESEIDSIYFEKAYYLEPDKGANKAYVLLREALRESKKVGIARFVLSNKEHLAAIRPQANVIVLSQLRFQQEIRKPEGLKVEAAQTQRKEVDLAVALIDQLTSPFEPENYRDTYADELKRIIDAKVKGEAPIRVAKKPEEAVVKDLMSLLKASLDRERQRERAKAS